MLAKRNRITKAKEIDSFFGIKFKKSRGRSVANKFLVLKVKSNSLKSSRFGFIVNLKVDKRAVVRNRVKRKLREIVFKHLKEVQGSHDVLFVVLKPAVDLEFVQLEETVLELLRKVSLR